MNNYALTRGWMDHHIFDADEPFTRREAWIWLIENANWKDIKKRVNGQLVVLRRGQLSHSIRFIAEKWLWHRNKVDRFFLELKNETMIETENGTGQNIITICNYDKYQLIPNFYETQNGTTFGTRAGHERDTSGTKKNTSIIPDNTGNNIISVEPKLFNEFWELFPRQRRGNKHKALKAYAKAIGRATEEEIYEGTRRYAASDEVSRGWGKGAEAWLNDDRWSVDYSIAPAAAHGKAAYGDSLSGAASAVYDSLRREEGLRDKEVP